jgi:hypothetical protein
LLCIVISIQYGDCEASCSRIYISVHLLIHCILRIVMIYAVMVIVQSFFYVLEVWNIKCVNLTISLVSDAGLLSYSICLVQKNGGFRKRQGGKWVENVFSYYICHWYESESKWKTRCTINVDNKAFLKIATTSLIWRLHAVLWLNVMSLVALRSWFLFSDTRVCQSIYPWKVTVKLFCVQVLM